MTADPIVCDCHRVTGTSVDAAIDRGARTVDEIGRVTHAGTGCGQCRVDLRRRLRGAAWVRFGRRLRVWLGGR